MSRPSGQKREREKARQQRAKTKAARREDRRNTADEPRAPTTPADEAAIMAELAELQRRFESDEISFDDFDEARQDLARRLDLR